MCKGGVWRHFIKAGRLRRLYGGALCGRACGAVDARNCQLAVACEQERSHSARVAALLKFFEYEGRFPRNRGELPQSAIEFLAQQVHVPADAWSEYRWEGRTFEYHRAQIRTALGFREGTAEDIEAMRQWMLIHLLAHERNVDRLKDAVAARCGEVRVEKIREKFIRISPESWEIPSTSASTLPPRPKQKAALERLSPADIHATEVAGEQIQQILTTAPGDGNPIVGIKVIAQDGWFAARPSGTEEIYKIYAESFLGQDHLRQIEQEAQTIVSETLARGCPGGGPTLFGQFLAAAAVDELFMTLSPQIAGRQADAVRPRLYRGGVCAGLCALVSIAQCEAKR